MGMGRQTEKMVKKEWEWSSKSDDKPAASTPPSPVIAADTGTQRRLQKIADNTGGMLDETKKRIGPGDIVFKNLPRALAVHGAWQEAQSTPGANLAQLSARPVTGLRAHSARRPGTSQRCTSSATRWRVVSSHTRYCLARRSPPWRLTGLYLATSTWKNERTD